MTRTQKGHQDILGQRQEDLVALARALLDAATHEENKQRLELYRLVAIELAQLLNETVERDGILYPDLGLTLVLFIELKKAGEPQAEHDRRDVLRMLDELN